MEERKNEYVGEMSQKTVELKPVTIGYTDIPTLEDYLEIDSYYDGFKEFIECCETPLTMAIQGDWGSGKTSALKLIEKKIDAKVMDEHGFPTKATLDDALNRFLNENQKCHVIWFNTWQYAHFGKENNLTLALLAHLASELKKLATSEERKEGLLKEAGKTLKEVLKTSTKVWFQKYDIDAVYEKIEHIFETIHTEGKLHFVTQDILEVKAQLQEIILSIPEGKRLVIFVDDLDRLDPKEAVDLLEGIKCFMDCPNCVFVLAIDAEVVNQGLSSKYGSSMDEKKKEMFFDKIIQIPFYIPTQKYNIKKYLENYFLKSKTEDASAAQTYIDKYVYTIQKLVGNNPRSIKRIFNLWELNKRVERIGNETDCYNMFVLLTVQVVNKKLYDKLVKEAIEKSSEEFFEKLCQVSTQEMNEWKEFAMVGSLLEKPDETHSFGELMEMRESASENHMEKYLEYDRKIKEWYQIRSLLVNTNRADMELFHEDISFTPNVRKLIEVLKKEGYTYSSESPDTCSFMENENRILLFERRESKTVKDTFYEKLTIYKAEDTNEVFEEKCKKIGTYGFRKSVAKNSYCVITNAHEPEASKNLEKCLIDIDILKE